MIDEKEKIATAYHEAGHAVVQYLLRPDADPIHKVTIIPRGRCGGATMTLPEKDRYNYSKQVVHRVHQDDASADASPRRCSPATSTPAPCGDIRQATGIARKMVRDWGMNDRLGFVFYGEDDNSPTVSATSAAAANTPKRPPRSIDEEVKKLIDGCTTRTRKLLEANRDRSKRWPRR